MAQWDNSAHHARQARKNTVLPAQMSKGGDKGPYVSEVAAGEMYDMIASDTAPMNPKEAGAISWHAVWSLTGFSQGQAVATIPDLALIQPPTNYDLTQATGSKQPLYQAGNGPNGYKGKPCVRFDGVDDMMNGNIFVPPGSGTLAGGAYFSLLIVGRMYQNPAGLEAWWCGNFGPKNVMTDATKRPITNGDLTGGPTLTSPFIMNTTTPVLLTITCFGDSTGTLRVNGQVDGVSGNKFGMDLNVQNFGVFNDGTSFPAHLDLFETCYFAKQTLAGDRPVSQRTIASVEKYLLQTYGL